MSELVKWVFDAYLQDNKRDAYVLAEENAIPVIPLADLTDWLRDEFFCMCRRPNDEHTATCAIRIGLRLINQLEAHRKEG